MTPKCTPDFGNRPAYHSHSSPPGVLCSFRIVKWMVVAAHHQANVLRLECQKRNEEDGQLKISKPEAVTCEYHRDSVKMSWHVNTTWRVSKNWKNSREEVAGSRANTLKFDHISQLDWELHQKWAIVKNKSERDKRLQMESLRNVSSTWSLAKMLPHLLQELCSQSRKGFHHKHPKGLGSHLCQEPCQGPFLLGGA